MLINQFIPEADVDGDAHGPSLNVFTPEATSSSWAWPQVYFSRSCSERVISPIFCELLPISADKWRRSFVAPSVTCRCWWVWSPATAATSGCQLPSIPNPRRLSLPIFTAAILSPAWLGINPAAVIGCYTPPGVASRMPGLCLQDAYWFPTP